MGAQWPVVGAESARDTPWLPQWPGGRHRHRHGSRSHGPSITKGGGAQGPSITKGLWGARWEVTPCADVLRGTGGRRAQGPRRSRDRLCHLIGTCLPLRVRGTHRADRV